MEGHVRAWGTCKEESTHIAMRRYTPRREVVGGGSDEVDASGSGEGGIGQRLGGLRAERRVKTPVLQHRRACAQGVGGGIAWLRHLTPSVAT